MSSFSSRFISFFGRRSKRISYSFTQFKCIYISIFLQLVQLKSIEDMQTKATENTMLEESIAIGDRDAAKILQTKKPFQSAMLKEPKEGRKSLGKKNNNNKKHSHKATIKCSHETNKKNSGFLYFL